MSAPSHPPRPVALPRGAEPARGRLVELVPRRDPRPGAAAPEIALAWSSWTRRASAISRYRRANSSRSGAYISCAHMPPPRRPARLNGITHCAQREGEGDAIAHEYESLCGEVWWGHVDEEQSDGDVDCMTCIIRRDRGR
jgi:hypothetical protein